MFQLSSSVEHWLNAESHSCHANMSASFKTYLWMIIRRCLFASNRSSLWGLQSVQWRWIAWHPWRLLSGMWPFLLWHSKNPYHLEILFYFEKAIIISFSWTPHKSPQLVSISSRLLCLYSCSSAQLQLTHWIETGASFSVGLQNMASFLRHCYSEVLIKSHQDIIAP